MNQYIKTQFNPKEALDIVNAYLSTCTGDPKYDLSITIAMRVLGQLVDDCVKNDVTSTQESIYNFINWKERYKKLEKGYKKLKKEKTNENI